MISEEKRGNLQNTSRIAVGLIALEITLRLLRKYRI